MTETNITLDELLDEMMLTSSLSLSTTATNLRISMFPFDRCRELVIGTYDCND
jgi:hypothetical protein